MYEITEKMENVELTINRDNNSQIFDVIFEKSKLIFDKVFSLSMLILLLPVFLIVILIIKIDDKGPAFYKHKRVGYLGKDLYVYKFRSMKMNGDKLLNEEQKEKYRKEFKLDNDPRITKIGAFLRKTSLDELPQLINILKGEMSLVGPRPVLKEEVELYGKNKGKLLRIMPGLTGYWQAYARNDATYESGLRQKMELYYCDNRCTILDVKIIFKTVETVLTGRGAK